MSMILRRLLTGRYVAFHTSASKQCLAPSLAPSLKPATQRIEANTVHVGRLNTSDGFPHKTLRQGHILDPIYRATQKDPHAEAARAGFAARKNLGFDHPYDAASPRRGTSFANKQERKGTGNPEGVGYADQVGGQSAAVGVFSGKK